MVDEEKLDRWFGEGQAVLREPLVKGPLKGYAYLAQCLCEVIDALRHCRMKLNSQTIDLKFYEGREERLLIRIGSANWVLVPKRNEFIYMKNRDWKVVRVRRVMNDECTAFDSVEVDLDPQ